jgi:hypothetical protein
MIMNDKVRLLLHKRWTGQISEEELSQLEALLASDPGLRKEASAVESILAKADPPVSADFVPNPDKEWVRFKKNLDGGAPVVSKPPRILSLLPFALVGKAAAAVAFVVMSYFAIQYILPGNQGSTAVIEKIKPHPESVIGGLVLPDGSVVWINSKTSFRYPESFDGDERRVFLDGEAHFQVRKDAARPFIVQTPNGEVRVLGTAFNVKAHSSGEYEEVYVESGIVAFKAKGGSEERKLKKGNAARLKKSTLQFISASEISYDNALRWKREALNFRDTPLKHILDALERHYSMHFDRSGIKGNILECQITISFVGASEETVVKYLETKTGMKVVPGVTPFTHRLTGGRCDN